MFESIIHGISEFFTNAMPHDFCLPCFLEGLAEGFGIGLFSIAALSVIAALSAPIAVALAVVLAVVGVVGLAYMAANWKNMDDRAKSKALGGIVGGLMAGKFGPKLMPPTTTLPPIQWLRFSDGSMMPALATATVTTPAVAGAATAIATAGAGGTAMMSAAGGGSGGTQGGNRTAGLTPEERAKIDKVRQEEFGYEPREPGSKDKTAGILKLDNGEEVPLISGKSHPPGQDGSPLQSYGSTERPVGPGSGFTGVTQDHVEGHAVTEMWESGAQSAELYIDNPPCAACDANIPDMLPPDSTLTVIHPDGVKVYYSSRTP